MKKKLIWWSFGLLTFAVAWATIPVLATLLTPIISTIVVASAVTVVASVTASCIVGLSLMVLNFVGKKLKKSLFDTKEKRMEKKNRKRYKRLIRLEKDLKLINENKEIERIRFTPEPEIENNFEFIKNQCNKNLSPLKKPVKNYKVYN